MKKMITRRNFLKAAGVSAAALGLAACGGSSASTAASLTVDSAKFLAIASVTAAGRSFTSIGVKSFTAMTVSTPEVKFSANATVVPNPITNATATKDFFIILYF